MKVSLELSFGIAYREEPAGHRCRQTDGTKQKRPGLAGAQLSTRILYHNGSAGQAKKLGAKERKVKTRSLKTEGCGTPRASSPPAPTAELSIGSQVRRTRRTTVWGAFRKACATALTESMTRVTIQLDYSDGTLLMRYGVFISQVSS